MFKKISRLYNYTKLKRIASVIEPTDNKRPEEIPSSINEIRCILNERFSDCVDLIIREIKITEKGIAVLIVFFEGLVNSHMVNTDLIFSFSPSSGIEISDLENLFVRLFTNPTISL